MSDAMNESLRAFDLSHPQQLAILMGGGSARRFGRDIRICGVIPSAGNLDALVAKVNRLVRDHEILRTRIARIDGVLGEAQIIAAERLLSLEWLDIDAAELRHGPTGHLG